MDNYNRQVNIILLNQFNQLGKISYKKILFEIIILY